MTANVSSPTAATTSLARTPARRRTAILRRSVSKSVLSAPSPRGRRPSMRMPSTAIGAGSRSRSASSWLRCSTQLLAMRQAGAGVGRMAAARLAPAPALDGETDPAPAHGAGQLVATDDVVGAASQPSGRVLGIGLDDDDDQRGALRHGGDLGRRRRRDVAVDEDGIESRRRCPAARSPPPSRRNRRSRSPARALRWRSRGGERPIRSRDPAPGKRHEPF